MGYEIIHIDEMTNEHWGKVSHLVQHKISNKFVDPRITKVWRCQEGQHDWLYQIHLLTKDGHGHEHHWTVLYEIRGQHGGHV